MDSLSRLAAYSAADIARDAGLLPSVRIRPLLALSAAVFALAACGGGGGDMPATQASNTGNTAAAAPAASPAATPAVVPTAAPTATPSTTNPQPMDIGGGGGGGGGGY